LWYHRELVTDGHELHESGENNFGHKFDGASHVVV
jgi:hypothetical protein